MKKAIALALAALVASAWAAPALAGEFSYGGFMRYRYQTGNPGTLNEVGFGFAQDDKTANLWEYRVRQFFNFKVNDHVTTNVKFEWNSEFGDERVLGGGSGDLQFGAVGTQELQFRVKNAFLRFDVPETPVTVTIGQQDFSTPKALISVEDGTGIKVEFKALGGEHAIWWSRLLRGANNQAANDDADWFGFAPAFNLGGIKISPHLSYLTAGATATNNAFFAGLPVANDRFNIWFYGVDTEGKVGPVGFTADLVFQNGKFKTSGGDLDIFSYILDVSASLAVGPGTLTLKALYSPGDDNDTDNDVDAWQNIISTDMGWSPFFHDGSDNTSFAGSVLPGVDDAGIIAFGAEFAFSPYRILTLTPNVYYLKAAENRVGATGNKAPSNGEDFYGVEAGVQANWKLWDAVNFLAQFDYLFAGDFFKTAAIGTKDAWRLIVGPSISW